MIIEIDRIFNDILNFITLVLSVELELPVLNVVPPDWSESFLLMV